MFDLQQIIKVSSAILSLVFTLTFGYSFINCLSFKMQFTLYCAYVWASLNKEKKSLLLVCVLDSLIFVESVHPHVHMPIAHIINVGFAVRRQSSELIQMDKKFTWRFLVAFHISMTWHSVFIKYSCAQCGTSVRFWIALNFTKPHKMFYCSWMLHSERNE